MAARSGALSLAEGWSCPGYSRQVPCWGNALAKVIVAEDWFLRCWCWWEAIFCAARSSKPGRHRARMLARRCGTHKGLTATRTDKIARSEEHTSELQSQSNLVCRL